MLNVDNYDNMNTDVYTLFAKRGYLYLFHDRNAQWTDKYVVVVSSDNRASDKMVSIIVLGDNRAGVDVVPVNIPNVGTKYAHCGMITYIQRQKLTEEICELPEATMDKIDEQLLVQLGLQDKHLVAECNFYEKAYKDLLKQMMRDNEVYK